MFLSSSSSLVLPYDLGLGNKNRSLPGVLGRSISTISTLGFLDKDFSIARSKLASSLLKELILWALLLKFLSSSKLLLGILPGFFLRIF